MSRFDEFNQSPGEISVGTDYGPLFKCALKNKLLAVVLAVSAAGASAGALTTSESMSSDLCASAEEIQKAKASGTVKEIQAAANKLPVYLEDALRTFQNASKDMRPGVDDALLNARDAKGTAHEEVANAASAAAQKVSFLTAAYKAIGEAYFNGGGVKGMNTTKDYLSKCHADYAANIDFFIKSEKAFIGKHKNPTLRESMAVAIKHIQASGAELSGVVVLKEKTDFQFDGEPSLSIIKQLQEDRRQAKFTHLAIR